MSIQVISNSVPVDQSAEAAKEEIKPELEANASEQNEVAESDAAETETEEKDDAEESESDEDEGKADDSEKNKPKKKGGFQRRIDKLNFRIAERERELEYWRGKATTPAGEKTEKVETKPVVDGKPNPDSFETHAEYIEALTDWKIEQKEKAAKEQDQKTKLQTEQQNLLEAHSERVKSFAKQTKDFDDVIAEVDDVIASAVVQELIVSSDNGPALMYELAKNRAEFERINKLPPLAAARELGRLESKLSEEKKPEPKKIPKAPKPLEPVGKGSSGSVTKSPENMSQSEYEAWRREQMRQKHA